MRLAIGLLALVLLFPATPGVAARDGADKENTVYLTLKYGRVIIRLRPDLAPKHVERVKKLVREGFYDGLTFHRVIPEFMAQTGDPTGKGSGGSKYPSLPAEFTDTPFSRGFIGAARTSDPNSANSQFFICFDAAPWLNGKYTVWGEVVSGMQFVDMIAKGDARTGAVDNPDQIVSMRLASDATN